jgi:hypothetical protein
MKRLARVQVPSVLRSQFMISRSPLYRRSIRPASRRSVGLIDNTLPVLARLPT